MANLLVMSAAIVLLGMAETAASSMSTYWASQCVAGNFTPGSPYGNSLEAVAAILPTRVGSSPLLFASESAAASHGEGEGEVYALAQCWRRSSRAVCERCIAAAFRNAQVFCQFREGAVVFRDKCTVAYYNKKIKQFPDDPSIDVVASRVDDSTQVTIQSSAFQDAVEKLQEAVVHGAATSPSSHFATGQTEFRAIDLQVTLYAAAQCLPSMADQDCSICLTKLLDEIQLSSAGPDLTPGRVASIWCSYRFSFERFFSGQPTLTVPAAEPPTGIAQSPTSKHNSGHSAISWVQVAVAGGVGATVTIIVVAVVLYCYMKTRLSRGNLPSGDREKAVQLEDRTGEEEVESQPSALDSFEQIVEMAKKKEIAIFLDYDGTLAPIVSDPDRAYMCNEMRGVLQNVVILFRTSIVSGRACDKLSDFVRINDINYAGSHGMDIKIATPTTEFASTSEIVKEDPYQPAKKYIGMINEVHNFLVHATGGINGANIENNKFCVSLHYRNVAKEDLHRVRRVVNKILKNRKGHIKLTKGHMVYEFRPPIKWDKGDAVLYLLKELGLSDSFSIYIGDDRTDEDAFKVLRDKNIGIGIVVAEKGRETHAFYSLKDPAQVMDFLKMLVEWKQEIDN